MLISPMNETKFIFNAAKVQNLKVQQSVQESNSYFLQPE